MKIWQIRADKDGGVTNLRHYFVRSKREDYSSRPFISKKTEHGTNPNFYNGFKLELVW